MHDALYNPHDPTGPSKSKFWALRHSPSRALGRWQWPLLTLGDREPIVLAEHINGARRGVDLGYESRPYDAELYVPVFAVQSGEVMFCGETTSGFAISVRHVGTSAPSGRRSTDTYRRCSCRTPRARGEDAPNGFEPAT